MQKMAALRLLLHTSGACCTCLAFFDHVGCPMQIVGPSMVPTINPGEFIWVSKVRRKPQIDDIFVFTPPSNPSRTNIKRIAGLEGQQVRNKQGKTVPDNSVWVLSDNPSNPTVFDSRAYGPVNMGLLKGRATAIIWPPQRWSRLSKKKKI